MKKSLPLSLFAGLLSFGFVHSGFSDTVTYEFGPDQETQNATITGSDVDVSASLFTLAGTGGYDSSGNGWGITGSAPTDSDSGANYLFIRGGAVTTSFDTSNYASFTITADTGSFNVTGASLFARTGGSGETTNFALRSDADGDNFNTDLLTGSATGSSSFQSFNTTTISGITGETSVEFRLYVWGANGTGDTHRYDDISLTVVPEPSMLGLVGCVGLWVLVRRRGRA